MMGNFPYCGKSVCGCWRMKYNHSQLAAHQCLQICRQKYHCLHRKPELFLVPEGMLAVFIIMSVSPSSCDVWWGVTPDYSFVALTSSGSANAADTTMSMRVLAIHFVAKILAVCFVVSQCCQVFPVWRKRNIFMTFHCIGLVFIAWHWLAEL